METRTRTIVKAATWQALGLVTMTLLGWLMTGEVATAGGFAVSAAAVGFVCFFLHERVWSRIGWGRR